MLVLSLSVTVGPGDEYDFLLSGCFFIREGADSLCKSDCTTKYQEKYKGEDPAHGVFDLNDGLHFRRPDKPMTDFIKIRPLPTSWQG